MHAMHTDDTKTYTPHVLLERFSAAPCMAARPFATASDAFGLRLDAFAAQTTAG